MSGKAAVVVILILLLAGGGAAYYFFVMKAGGGALPAEALALPGDSTMLMGVGVKPFMTTIRRLLDGNFAGLPIPPEARAELPKAKGEIEKGLKELEEKTGIRLDQDLDHLVVGLWGVGGRTEPKGAGVVVGRFDRAKVTAAIEKGMKEGGATPTVKEHAGAKIFIEGTTAVAVASERVLVFGDLAVVETTLTNLSQKTKTLNPSLVDLAGRVRGGATFWLVGGEALMSAAGQQAASMPFPMPKSFVMSDHPDAGIEVLVQMSSSESAKAAASMIKNGLDVAKAQAADKLALKDINPEVSSSGSEVRLALRLPGGLNGAGVGVIAAVAIPSLLRARMNANEAAATADIRSVISAQATYQAHSPSRLDFGEMRCLGELTSCIPDYSGPTFIDPSLASLADKSGYKRSFFAGEPGEAPGGLKSYAYTAVPIQPGKTGQGSFCGDDSGVICINYDGSPFDAQGGRCPPGCTPLM